MIDISRVDVRARLEKHIDDTARSCKVQRRLSIAASLVHTRRIVSKNFGEQIRAIDVSRSARVGNRATLNQSIGSGSSRLMERVESAGPPITAAIWVSSEIEQHVDHRRVFGKSDDRW